jgi:hypothetical protein
MARVFFLSLLALCYTARSQSLEAQVLERQADREPESWRLNLQLKHVGNMVNSPASANAKQAFDFKRVVFESQKAFGQRAGRTPSEALEAGMKFDAIEFRARLKSQLGDSEIDWRQDYRNNRPSVALPRRE